MTPASPLSEIPHRFPRAFTSFVGRASEIAAACNLLLASEIRLLTLTGSGGIGKTRLAIAVGERLAPAFAGEVYWVALAPISDPGLVMSAIAGALGISDLGQRSIEEQVGTYLQRRRALVVIDNFEQIIDAAPRISDLLGRCPDISILVTSRLPLRIQGEQQFPVQPLASPKFEGAISVDDVVQSDSARLFIERARSVRPSFALTPDNAQVVAEICRRLEGVPLAIELAAARISVLSPQGMLARLDPGLPLLVGGPRDQPPRLQSMRGAIQWSWDLLSPAEQALLRRMAVFRGGCTLECLQEIAGMDLPASLIDTLSTLIDHNLVRSEEDPDGEPRFDMLVVVREFAQDRLEQSGELRLLRQRHAEVFTGIAEDAGMHIYEANDGWWLDRIDREHDNMRAALEYTLNSGEVELSLRLAGALGHFWYVRGHMGEGRRWLEAALGHADGVAEPIRVKAVYALADLAQEQGDYAVARSLFEDCLASYQLCGDVEGVVGSILGVSIAAWLLEDMELAITSFDEGLKLARETGEGPITGIFLLVLAWHELMYNEDEIRTRAYIDESMTLARTFGDQCGIADALHIQALLAIKQGNDVEAEVLLKESIQIFRQLADKRGIAYCLEAFASIMAIQRHALLAAELAGAAAMLRETIGRPRHRLEMPLYQRFVDAARASVSADAWSGAFAKGHAMPIGEIVAFSPWESREAVEQDAEQVLTPRQVEILQLVANGRSNLEIAAELFISPNTVSNHVTNIMNKLGVDSRTAAATYALRHQLI